MITVRKLITMPSSNIGHKFSDFRATINSLIEVVEHQSETIKSQQKQIDRLKSIKQVNYENIKLSIS